MDSCKSADSEECRIAAFVLRTIRLPFYFILAFLFFVGALFINFLQLLNYLAFEYTFPWLRRNINYYLQDIILNREFRHSVMHSVLIHFGYYPQRLQSS